MVGGVLFSRPKSLELWCLSRGLDFSNGGGVDILGLLALGGVADVLTLDR